MAFVNSLLGKDADWGPPFDEREFWYEKAIDLLKNPALKSGYEEVQRISDESFEAKVYLRPKVQRSLGSFSTARAAAEVVFEFLTGQRPPPPTPPKRNRRGEGRAPRIRKGRKGRGGSAGVQASSAVATTVAGAHLELEVSEEPPEGSLVVGGVVP